MKRLFDGQLQLPSALAVIAILGSTAVHAAVPFTIQGPGVDANDFRQTTFATGANFPVGMVELDDGSILVAESNGTSFFGSSSGKLVRYADTDNDGESDTSSSLVSNVAGGGLTALRKAGDLFITTGQGKTVSIYRAGATPSDSLSLQGTISLGYPGGGWLHPHSALSVRETPGLPGSYDVVFQLGSDTNNNDTTRTVSVSSNIGLSGTLNGDALHMFRLTDNGSSVSGSNLTQLATGLRNAAGHAFDPINGDLYLEDNGIDGIPPNPAIEPTSADELNLIPAADIGGAVEDFGFPSTYIEYRTGNQIGSTGILPEVAFLPIPNPSNGAEGEGPNDIAFAPDVFPVGLHRGIFVGMHGQFSSGGVSNEENPLVYVDLSDPNNPDYFHFISNTESDVGHLDGLLSTSDSLFIADISPDGGLGSSDDNEGVIYQLKSLIPCLRDGDADGDGVIGDIDIGIHFGAYTGNVGVLGLKGCRDGDNDGDHDVDDLDIGVVFGNYNQGGDTANADAHVADAADLIYDPATGEVSLDQTAAPGGVITNFVLQSDNMFNAPGVAQFPFASPFKNDTANQISNSDTLFAGMPTDVWNLGAILPGNLKRAELVEKLTRATFVGELGSGVRNFEIIVPEPSSVLMLVLGMASLGLRGRRRSST